MGERVHLSTLVGNLSGKAVIIAAMLKNPLVHSAKFPGACHAHHVNKRSRTRKPVTLRVAVLMLALMGASATPLAIELPDLGEVANASISESQEGKIGREVMRHIRDSGNFLEDPVLVEYLNTLGDQLASASTEPSMRFEFFAVRDPSINAFALPGGHIGVHTGLLSAARTESELAGVLSHEIAHVTQKHIVRMVDGQKTSNVASLLALAIAILASRSNSEVSQAALAGAQALSVQSQLNFTREHEREADRVGLQTLTAAGYSSHGMASFFERLQSQGRLYESNAPAYLRTHPLTFERIADMQNRLDKLPYRQHEDSLSFRFVRARVQADEGIAADAVRRIKAQLNVASEGLPKMEALYGLVRAALRDNDMKLAKDSFQAMLKVDAKLAGQSPLVALLHGELLLEEALQSSPKATEAVAVLSASLKQHSAYRPLAYLYVRALLRQGQAKQALDFIHQQQRFWSSDLYFQQLAAESYQALGQVARAHLAQAEVYVLKDRTGAAIEQLQLAQMQRNTDFYTQSIIDARLRELKEKRALESAK